MIDPKRPVETTENHPRKCRTIGVLERTEGVVTLLLAVPWRGCEASTEIEIDLNGKPVAKRSTRLTFRNEPKIESGFYPLSDRGELEGFSGRSILDIAKSDCPNHDFFLEVIRTDGVVSGVKLHER